MDNSGSNYRLPATDCSHANQEDEDSKYDSDSDSDSYYSAYSNTYDEQRDASEADLTSDISMKADPIDELCDLSEQHYITVADVNPDVEDGNDQRSLLIRLIIHIKAAADESLDMDPFANCRRTLHVYLDLNTSLITMADHSIDPGHSDSYYSAYSNTYDEQRDASEADLTSDISMKADPIDELCDLSEQHYITVADVNPDVEDGNDQRSLLIRLIIHIKAAADESLDMDPFANCRRTLHVYLDLNTSLITMADHSIDPGRIVKEPSCISIKISECFY
ncbi:unnamed protein product [Mytilus edulis]|uniref:Uncharacterized protein n=1 Tax=Mytilus edulis TaxID=6550 RepID=A0A8S3UV80_MYTED|nr:unnamed protein product [Mytilus edulis]